MAVRGEPVGAYRMEIVAQLLSEAEQSITRRLSQVLGDTSIERWRTLVLLADGEGHSMTEIADFALLPAPSLTRLIDGMVSDGFVYRRVDPADRRRVLVFASRAGRELRRRLAERIEKEQAFVLPDADLAELDELVALLVSFTDRLREQDLLLSSRLGSLRPISAFHQS
jgi:DNA-binding MarR family transcriptional regulator